MADETTRGEIPLRSLWSDQDSDDDTESSLTFETFETPMLEMPESPMIPKLVTPRGSLREIVRRESSYLLRAMGLSLISMKLDPDAQKPEVKKVLIQNSFWVAVARICIHLPPLAGTVVLFWLNLSGFFVGSQLSGPSDMSDDVKFQVLQFVAKAHELLIISSTGTVVFHTLRTQLFEGIGVPLGLIASGFNFSDPSFFW
jgi:hypothetical protein